MYVNKGVFKKINLVISQVHRQVRAGFSLLPVGTWSRTALASGEKNTDSFDLTSCRYAIPNPMSLGTCRVRYNLRIQIWMFRLVDFGNGGSL